MARGGAERCSDSECWALTIEALNRWMETSSPGEQIIYAKGPRLLRTPGVEAISGLRERGEVRLNFTRGGDGCGHYVATRLQPSARPRPVRAAPPHHQAPTRDETQRVMAVLRRYANMERPCPTNADIAFQADLKTPQQAAYQISKLIGAGQVRVETATDGQRVVTIVATGRRTARMASGR